MSKRPIHIVGGGVGGLALGIRLRQLKVKTRISELGTYPRHRVCGEFISGRGVELLRKLGVYEAFLRSGGRVAKTMKFFGNRAMSPVIRMPQPAFCISRYAMDRIMSDQFKSMGGELCTGLRIASEKLLDEGTVLANGRKPNTEKHATWTGYKFHIQGLKLEADLEMHFTELGYLGMCQVESGRVNVCGLMPSTLASGLNLRSNWKGFLRVNLHPKKHQALESIEMIGGSTCCVSGISYNASQLSKTNSLLRVGDRMSTIPPLTGNGMSLAIESSWLASEPIARYADNHQNWSQTLEYLAVLQTRFFQKRLAVSVPLQHVMMAPFMHGVREHVINRLSLFHKILFNLTR